LDLLQPEVLNFAMLVVDQSESVQGISRVNERTYAEIVMDNV